MVSTGMPDVNKNELCKEAATEWQSIEPIRHNAAAQKKSFKTIKNLESELSELEQMAVITTNSQCYNSLSSQITEIKKNITEEEEWLKKLKRHMFKKLAGVTLEIDHFENYLNSQGEICDHDLGLYPIYGKPVYVEYVDKESNSCAEVEFTTPENTDAPSLKEKNLPRSQANSATFDDFSLLPSLSKAWLQVVIVQSQSLSDIE
ncbi:12520_t:CDS:2 [Dentiscutata erythropus]|uniref:12520_t:CDS:1 n=1 Tax=Dentiscutata erythropus TaxID=1348616 RepID=A0A9N9EVP7_9GLOM|nr:12520_t:CDS:2 [Dentiscutata erythropus]